MIALFSLLAFVVAVFGTGAVRRYALASSLLDVPNERSSHAVPTPRGGGVAIAVSVTVTVALFHVVVPGTWSALVVAWLAGAAAVALIGYVDDRRGVSPWTRLATHGGAAFAPAALLGLPPIAFGSDVLVLGIAGAVLAWFAIVWSINLFNFMDGTDGIAAGQASFVLAGSAALLAWQGAAPQNVAPLAITAAAAFGFLVWNLPPARIFMGDVGSGFLGFSIGALALISAHDGLSVWTWLVLHAAFVCDATMTLVVRAIRGERLHAAHRSHVYQRLSRRWKSHRAVLGVYSIVNFAVLLPMALWTVVRPDLGALAAGGTLGVGLFAAAALGAGRPDVP